MNLLVKPSRFFYYLGLFFTALTSTVIGTTYLFLIPGLNPIIKGIAILFYMLSILSRRWNRKKLLCTAGAIVLVLIIAVIADSNVLVLYVLAILLGDQENFYYVCKFLFWTNTMFLLLVVGLCGLGILGNETYLHYGVKAYSMGFVYYSTMAYLILFLTIMGYYLLSEKKSKQIVYILFSLLINYFVYKITTTKLAFFCLIIFIILTFIYTKFKLIRYRKVNMIMATLMYPIMFILSIVLPFQYLKSRILVALDYILNGRLYFSHMAFERYQVTLFGNEIITDAGGYDENWHNTYFYIDSGYVKLLIGYGIIFCALILFAYTILSRYAVKTKNTKLFVWSMVVCIFSFVNNAMINVILNPFLLVTISLCSFRKKKQEKYKNWMTDMRL